MNTTPFAAQRDEAQRVHDVIEAILRRCPRRGPTTPDEARAQEMIAGFFEEIGVDVRSHRFEFNDSVYANLALHFGLSTVASRLAGSAPVLASALHALVATSYTLDSAHKAFLLRRLFEWRASSNVIATLPATQEPRLRVVFVSHSDAAFTGTLFEPWFIRRFGSHDPILGKSLRLATASVAALSILGWKTRSRSRALWVRALRGALTLPSLFAFLLNLDIVLRNHLVPGANDNLSGVAGNLLLAARLRDTKPDDVECVFVSTGCEEASLGGATALARDMRGKWDNARTVVLGIDGLSNGELRYFTEGEVLPIPRVGWLTRVIDELAAADPNWNHVAPFEIPVGATDVAAFRANGFDGVCIGTVDPELGTPRNYHHPTDTLENLDPSQVVESVDFVERVFRAICDHPRFA